MAGGYGKPNWDGMDAAPLPNVPWEEQVHAQQWNIDPPPSLRMTDEELAQCSTESIANELHFFWSRQVREGHAERCFAALARFCKNRDFSRFCHSYGMLHWCRVGRQYALEASGRLEKEYWKRLLDEQLEPEAARARMQRNRLASDAADCMELVHESLAEELERRLAARKADGQEKDYLLAEAKLFASEAAYCRDLEDRCRDLLSAAVYHDLHGKQAEGAFIAWRSVGNCGVRLDPQKAQQMENDTQEKKGDLRWLENSVRWMREWSRNLSLTDSLSARRAEAISVQLERDAEQLRQEISRDETILDAYFQRSMHS